MPLVHAVPVAGLFWTLAKPGMCRSGSALMAALWLVCCGVWVVVSIVNLKR